MIQGQEFPVLTRSRRVSPEILDILKSIDIGAGKQSRVNARLLTRLDEVTMQTLPEIVERVLGPDHPEFAIMLHRLAVLYHSRDNLEKAEFLYRRALDTAERAFEEPEMEWGLMMNNLGRLLYEQKKLAEAERLYQRGLGILQESLGPEHPKLATPLSNLATLYMDQGKQDLAENLYQDSITILVNAYGPDHPKVLRARNRIARHRNR